MKNGNVEIVLPENEEITICCSKVGYMQNGEFILETAFADSDVKLNTLQNAKQMEAAARRLEPYVKSGFLVETNEEGVSKLEDLEEGVYLLNSYDIKEGKTILPTLLFLPSWDEAEEKMLYDITIVPKYGEKQVGLMTGDGNQVTTWMLLGTISMILLVGIFRKSKKRGLFF